MIRIALVVSLACAACGPGIKGGPTMNNKMNQPDPTPQVSPVVSADILAREPLANTAEIKHILIGWKGTDSHDPRAEKRTKQDAEATIRDVLKQLQDGADFDAMMKKYSEDPGSSTTGRTYTVSPDASLVIEFKQLGLRLKVGEIGVVQSDYGFHIMKRVD
ncbi:MAG TPA: peptidylprolyl isomerase [Kofleriaceae bacterium]|nr:peptidylprolyl isomerase [Kofleriaceae bacterium]